MLEIIIGKENRELLKVGPSEMTDIVDQNEFERLLLECNKHPDKYWIRIKSEFKWNERVSRNFKKLNTVNMFLIGDTLGYAEILGLLCSIGDSEGYLQQINGEF
jgi:hypothetical protein